MQLAVERTPGVPCFGCFGCVGEVGSCGFGVGMRAAVTPVWLKAWALSVDKYDKIVVRS